MMNASSVDGAAGIATASIAHHAKLNGGGGTSNTTSSSPTTTTTTTGVQGLVSIAVLLKWCLLEIPLLLSFALVLASYGLYDIYTGPIAQLVQSFQLSTDEVDDTGFYLARDEEVTYYNRRCHQEDISTHDANDLLITPSLTQQQRRDVMMTHGAVVLPHVLQSTTAAALRDYLEGRHEVFHQGKLPWFEKFWDGDNGNRLALGLGPEDSPIIAQAMAEVGQNRQVQKTVEAVLGPNPAIVEVSTLSTMSGAEAQGIHTDSDFFGSSVLYSRTFLHSYTLFIALQNTTAKLGATTVCPGTHMCANDDLEHLCMVQREDNDDQEDSGAPDADGGRGNSFEASSNGHTGREAGMLHRGDGFMFNQNVWHRGPPNYDPQFLGMNRVMFILTFISRREFDRGDARQQGWGTYYYMRNNMWGQTFQDLKLAITPTTTWMNGMTLPWRFWRAYCEGNSGRQATGAITWLEHWTRQMANYMDFYSYGELEEFKQLIETSSPIPNIFWGDNKTEDWYEYLKEMIGKVKEVSIKVYGGALGAYLGLYLVYALWTMLWSRKVSATASSLSPKRSSGIVRFLLFLVIKHSLVLGVASLAWYMIHHRSPLFQRIHSGRVVFKPFPSSTSPTGSGVDNGGSVAHLDGRVTTLPERMDVLIGTRFDAEWLGVYNDMLEYHPGNKDWNQLIHQVAGTKLPTDVVVRALLEQTQKPVQGVSRRFLLQDYKMGYWMVMTPSEAFEENRRALIMARYPLLKLQAKYWKEVLSESRFGLHRETAYSMKWVPLIVKDWMAKVVFATTTTPTSKATSPHIRSAAKQKSFPFTTMQLVQPVKKSQRPSSLQGWLRLSKDYNSEIHLNVGDYVLVKRRGPESYPTRAKIVEILSPSTCRVKSLDHARVKVVSLDDIEPIRPVQGGDSVETFVDDELTTYTVVMVHPLGSCGAISSDGQPDYLTVRELQYNDEEFPSYRLAWSGGSRQSSHGGSIGSGQDGIPLEVGQRVLANYNEAGEYFPGEIIMATHWPKTGEYTYHIEYEDGDMEQRVARRNILIS
jgi:hypothetical protein